MSGLDDVVCGPLVFLNDDALAINSVCDVVGASGFVGRLCE